MPGLLLGEPDVAAAPQPPLPREPGLTDAGRRRIFVVSDPAAELWLARLDAIAEPLAGLEAADALSPAGDLEGLDASRRAARLLLRRLVARMFGRGVAAQPFATGAHGKPSLPGLAGDFNLSHTLAAGYGPVALIGLGRVRAIGVDVEPLRTVRIDARRRSMIVAAAQHVCGAPRRCRENDDARIVQAWARLEAWGKPMAVHRTDAHAFWCARPGGAFLRAGRCGAGERGDLTVSDVDAGPSLFAAVALMRGETIPPVRHLRDAAELVSALAGGEAVGKSGV